MGRHAGLSPWIHRKGNRKQWEAWCSCEVRKNHLTASPVKNKSREEEAVLKLKDSSESGPVRVYLRGKSELLFDGLPGIPGDPLRPLIVPFILISST